MRAHDISGEAFTAAENHAQNDFFKSCISKLGKL